MSQANKKAANQSSPSAKLAANIAENAKKEAYSAVETTRNAAENVVRIGNSAVREFMSSGAGEAKKAQEKAFEMSRESAEQFAKSADAATKLVSEVVSLSRGNIETCVECGNLTASFARDLGTEAFEAANRALSDNMEVSKEFFGCRTINDFFDVQNRMFNQSLDNFFSQSSRLSNMMFEYTTEALEPINERVAEATEQLSKAVAA